MLHHLLFVASPEQIALTRSALDRLKAQPLSTSGDLGHGYQLSHPLLDQLTLNIHIISDLDAITPHLRRNPVDLLIYDERHGGIEARAALHKIRDDMLALANLWGPDFMFPMSRVVAILAHEQNEAMRAFELGRVQVRDVCVAPRNTAHRCFWSRHLKLILHRRKNLVRIELAR